MNLLGLRRERDADLVGSHTAKAQVHLVRNAERLFWGWCAMAGVALFLAWWLHGRGIWMAMLDGDPSGISAGIVVLTVIVTGWCGLRARTLALQSRASSAWRQAFAHEQDRGHEAALQRLAERTHGSHETAWWFAGACIKLGLLGTVVGFIVMSMQIGRMPNFDFDQVQVLLKRMTEGMAIALYTTLAGLIANLWLGLQLMLLDRQADALAADMLVDPTPAGTVH